MIKRHTYLMALSFKAMRVVSVLVVSGLALLYCQVEALPHPQDEEEEVEEDEVGEDYGDVDSDSSASVGRFRTISY